MSSNEQTKGCFTNYSAARILQLSWVKAYLGLKSESNRTYLGFIWWLIEPAVHLTVYYLVFVKLLHRGGPDFVLFLLTGVVHWLWFSKSVNAASTSIIGGRSLINQLRIPKIIFPVSMLFQDLIKQVVVLFVFLSFLVLLGVNVSPTWLFYPLLLVVQILLMLTISLAVSMMVPVFPDVKLLIPPVLQFGMFVSGIFFTRDTIPQQYHVYLELNPMFVLIEGYRDVLIRGELPNVSLMSPIILVSIGLLATLIFLMKKYDSKLARFVLE